MDELAFSALYDPCQLGVSDEWNITFFSETLVPWSSCFYLPGTKIAGLHRHTQLKGYLLLFFNLKPSWKGVLALSSYSTTKNCGSQSDKWQSELRDKMTMTKCAEGLD